MNKQTVIQWLKYVAIAAISFFLLLFVLGGLIFGYYAMKAPTLSEKDLVATTSSKIYDNQNNLIADLGAEKRINVTAMKSLLIWSMLSLRLKTTVSSITVGSTSFGSAVPSFTTYEEEVKVGQP